MRSSAERFWKIVEGWQRRKSQIRVSFNHPLLGFGSSDFLVDSFVFRESITFRKIDTGELHEPLDLRNAEIRVSGLPYPVEKAKGLEELEYGFCFNIMWPGERDFETRCSLCEIRDFGRTI